MLRLMPSLTLPARFLLLAAVIVIPATIGCQEVPKFSELPTPGEALHNLKPHRLWRLNRTDAGMSREAYFSVPNPTTVHGVSGAEGGSTIED